MKTIIALVFSLFAVQAQAWCLFNCPEPVYQTVFELGEKPAAEVKSWGKGVDNSRPMHASQMWEVKNRVNTSDETSGVKGRHFWILVKVQDGDKVYGDIVTILTSKFSNKEKAKEELKEMIKESVKSLTAQALAS